MSYSSRLKTHEFTPLIVTNDVMREMQTQLIGESADKKDPILPPVNRNRSTLTQWDKATYLQISLKVAQFTEGHLPRWANDINFLYCAIMPKRAARLENAEFSDYGSWYVNTGVVLSTAAAMEKAQKSNEEDVRDFIGVVEHLSIMVLQAIMDRPTEFQLARTPRSPLQIAKGNVPLSHTVTLSLSAPKIETVGSHPGTGISGWKMPLHRVKEHLRRLRSGEVIIIHSHERGDPDVPRRTVTRIVP